MEFILRGQRPTRPISLVLDQRDLQLFTQLLTRALTCLGTPAAKTAETYSKMSKNDTTDKSKTHR